ncbi:hypothetical protein MMC11_006683 [Xylographa trunciseda]|nr:hypothetical protein [Xylographa trunciseda]
MAPKPKKTVSVSAIFGGHGGHKEEILKDFGHSSKISKNKRFKKHEKTSEHSLATDFSEKIELCRVQILENATGAISSTHHILLERLASTSASSANFIEEATAIRDELMKPLAQEILQFRGPDGKPTGTATLGDRMRTFKKRIAKEEKELETLWKEWAAIQNLIIDVGVEMLGFEAFGAIGAQPLGLLESGSRNVENIQVAQEINKEKDKLGQEIETMSVGLVERMYASEKV